MRVLCAVLGLLTTVAHAADAVVRREARHDDVLDAYLWQSSPDANSGTSTAFYTGLVGGGDKAALIRFDVSFIPKGAVVTRANVVLDTAGDGQVEVRVHAAAAPWNEREVTWNTFDAGYAPMPLVTFLPAAPSFSITPLVQQWVNGARNDGILLAEAPGANPSTFSSSDSPDVSLRPRLELQFTSPRLEETVTLMKPDAGGLPGDGDAYVWEAAPDTNFCCTGFDTSGLYDMGGQKVALIRFDLAPIPAGSTVLSATLRLHHDVGHALNETWLWASDAGWDETTVTWAAFEGLLPQGDPPIVFPPATDGGATEAEVRALVQGWVNGAPNHGFVLSEEPGVLATWWHSNESDVALRPQLEVRFVRPFVDAGTPGLDGGGPSADGGSTRPGPRSFGLGCASAPGGWASLALLAVLRAGRRRPRCR